jgi:glutathione peroxidase
MNLYDIKINLLHGEALDFSKYQGKKVLIVNTASACGLTPQYAQLQELYENHQDIIEIIGIPCNDFADQESGSANEIQQFCDTNYKISFPLTEKVKIKGDHIHPLYQFLTQKSLNNLENSEVSWNFQKYLINENGDLIQVFSPRTEVLSEEVLRAIGISL